MRDFSQLAQQLHPRVPLLAELWTFYHLQEHPYPRCPSDWGKCLAYHFDRGVSVASWLPLVGAVRNWVESQPELREVIKFVPFYEVGSDFFTQCKPPYDGGYPTTMYEEFLYHRSCEPAPWFFQQLAALHEKVAEALRSLRNGPKDVLLSKAIHATFIKPYGHLFWADEDGWALYQPNISVADVREWEKVS